MDEMTEKEMKSIKMSTLYELLKLIYPHLPSANVSKIANATPNDVILLLIKKYPLCSFHKGYKFYSVLCLLNIAS